jgi:DNA primase
MISQTTIQQILGRLDIIEVIGGFVKLKKRGANWLGLCPFHNEKTPSFIVSPSKEIYKCFGCGRSGNTISFLMEHEKYSYVESLRWLAAKYNVEIEESFQNDEEKQVQLTAESLFIINQFARDFFSGKLFDTEEGRDIGLSYFKERGFREEFIRKFQLGYSPEQRDSFAKEALARKYNPELLLRSGLVVKRNDDYLDNYRGRVIFPVHNHSGKVIGFGARILKSNDKSPKYINSPENEIYVKSKVLYGSYFARQAIDKADECLLVEGYTDVISLHQAGIENTVASGGTSLTVDQLRLIRKYSNNLTIIYDGDPAGIKAALRGLDLALEEGLQVKLVLLPASEDPDSYVNKIGATAFREFIKEHKKDFLLFQLEVAMKEAGNDSNKKAEAINRIAESISRINKAEDFTRQQDYIRQCSQLLKIDEAGLHSLVNKFIRERISVIERKLPAEEAKLIEENTAKAARAGYDDATFDLLFKDELQEREFARILLEYGSRSWDEKSTVADHLFGEMMDESLMDNKQILALVTNYRKAMREKLQQDIKSYFIYHADPLISALTVSLLNFPYQESERWKKEFSQSGGYRKELFEKDYHEFLRIVKDNDEALTGYLTKMEDRMHEEAESALNYLKLRKLRKMMLENQQDMEKQHSEEEQTILHQTHRHLKELEIELTRKTGAVIVR